MKTKTNFLKKEPYMREFLQKQYDNSYWVIFDGKLYDSLSSLTRSPAHMGAMVVDALAKERGGTPLNEIMVWAYK